MSRRRPKAPTTTSASGWVRREFLPGKLLAVGIQADTAIGSGDECSGHELRCEDWLRPGVRSIRKAPSEAIRPAEGSRTFRPSAGELANPGILLRVAAGTCFAIGTGGGQPMPNQSKSKPARDQAIHYNENAAKYAGSGRAKEAAEQAKRAIQDPRQAAALRKAEKAGKRPARSS